MALISAHVDDAESLDGGDCRGAYSPPSTHAAPVPNLSQTIIIFFIKIVFNLFVFSWWHVYFFIKFVFNLFDWA